MLVSNAAVMGSLRCHTHRMTWNKFDFHDWFDTELMRSTGSDEDPDLASLRRGASLWKLRRKRSYNWYHRRYWLDDQLLRLYYEPSYKLFRTSSAPYIDIMDVVDVRYGWKTTVFNEASRREGSRRAGSRHAGSRRAKPQLLDEQSCFSIIHSDKSLDLMAPDHVTAATWVRGLNTLVRLVNSIKDRKNGHRYHQLTCYQLLLFAN